MDIMIKNIKFFNILIVTMLLTSCSTSRYQYANDHHPDEIPPLDHVEDAIPRYEPPSRGGNKDYRVRGIDYKVLKGATEFSEQGYASWYGNKFHGHLTANGERYDMFAMTAAHKNVPLPSYLEVTNLENNKKVVVRVNDRGPFHEGRVIDLSYAAAHKLDIIKSGTAKVEVKLIHIAKDKNEFKNDFVNGYFYVQYFVTSQHERAQQLSKQLSEEYQIEQAIVKDNSKYRLRLGPVNSEQKAKELLLKLQQKYSSAFIIHQQKRYILEIND